MPTPAPETARELRTAIDELSARTRSAMLAAVRCPGTRIIAGEYVAPGGGVCPLLAAHRRGGRTHDEASASSPFAAVWDRFTGTPTGEPQEVGRDALRELEAMLVASLERERRPRPGDPDRGRELAGREGWAWLGVYRRYDAYRVAVADALAREASSAAGPADAPSSCEGTRVTA